MRGQWDVEEGVTCVVCPACAFTFDAVHTDSNGGWSCPACAEDLKFRTLRLEPDDVLVIAVPEAALWQSAEQVAMIEQKVGRKVLLMTTDTKLSIIRKASV